MAVNTYVVNLFLFGTIKKSGKKAKILYVQSRLYDSKP